MKIAVFCGSRMGNDKAFEEAAIEVGSWIGAQKHTLVYGGGEAGLMGTVSKAAFEANSEVIGVIPVDVDFIKDRPQPYVTTLITTRNMSERKEKMMEMSDVFIAIPGGMGTLDEISEAITLNMIGTYDKPCIFYNKNNFYDPLIRMIEDMKKAGFIVDSAVKQVLFTDDLKVIEAFIK